MQPLASDVWLMERNAFQQLAGFASLSVRMDPEQAKAIATAAPRRQKQIGIIPIHGALEARPSWIGEMFGMSSYERVGQAFDILMSDESVAGIILDIASPGGMVYGAQELAAKIFAARGRKPVVAVANPLAASGAYWVAAAADRVVVTPSGDVGSVGVIVEHLDLSQAMEREGVKATVIRSSDAPRKGEGNPYEPLSDDARAHIQSRADAIHTKFVGDLARFRGVSVEVVNSSFGQGRVVDSKRALAAGMVDRVATMEDTVMRMVEGRIRLGGAAAMDCWDAMTPREAVREKIAAIQALN